VAFSFIMPGNTKKGDHCCLLNIPSPAKYGMIWFSADSHRRRKREQTSGEFQEVPDERHIELN
jgi:hypothetical protein